MRLSFEIRCSKVNSGEASSHPGLPQPGGMADADLGDEDRFSVVA
jgi:hypothetical protein